MDFEQFKSVKDGDLKVIDEAIDDLHHLLEEYFDLGNVRVDNAREKLGKVQIVMADFIRAVNTIEEQDFTLDADEEEDEEEEEDESE